MARNDYSTITTASQLRQARKAVEAEAAAYDERIRQNCNAVQTMLSPRVILLPLIRKVREYLMNR